MAIPGFTAEQTLYASRRRYRGRSHHSGLGNNTVSIAACPGVVTGMGQSVGDARFFPVVRFNLAFGRARFDAQSKCPTGCIFDPFPIGGAQGIGVTRAREMAVGRPIETLRIQASFRCISPPRPQAPPSGPSGVETALLVLAAVGLGVAFVVTVIDPIPGDEVAVGGLLGGVLSAL